MSEQDQDAIVGRLMREKSQAVRRKAALDAELKMLTEGVEKAFRHIHMTPIENVTRALEPIRKYLDADAILALLRERQETQAEIEEKARSLRGLGATD